MGEKKCLGKKKNEVVSSGHVEIKLRFKFIFLFFCWKGKMMKGTALPDFSCVRREWKKRAITCWMLRAWKWTWMPTFTGCSSIQEGWLSVPFYFVRRKWIVGWFAWLLWPGCEQVVSKINSSLPICSWYFFLRWGVTLDYFSDWPAPVV